MELNSVEPELKTEDCKLNICGFRSVLFFERKEVFKFSIINRKYPIIL